MKFPRLFRRADREPNDEALTAEAYHRRIIREMIRERRYYMMTRLLRTAAFASITVLILFNAMFAKDGFLFGAKTKDHIAVVSINGEIAKDKEASADQLIPAFEKAFENRRAKAVVARINSPGGSPVQAGHIYDELIYLQKQHTNKKLYAVIDDLGASGGYYIAVAAPTIIADRASMVGSIGVISSSFGFTGLMEKLGIERRTFVSGKNKALLDPYAPISNDMRAFWQSQLALTHDQFISRVKASRGSKLTNDPDNFTGLIWNGEEAERRGLIDSLGSVYTVSRELGDLPVVDYTPEAPLRRGLFGGLGVLFEGAVDRLMAHIGSIFG